MTVPNTGQGARKNILTALEHGQTRLGLQLRLGPCAARGAGAVVQDASGDSLDAVLCLLQEAAWADARHAAGDPLYGLPPALDPLEGWIITT